MLQQGDWLVGCPVPIFDAQFASAVSGDRGRIDLAQTDVIVVTQSCDLEVREGRPPKARLVAVCPIYSLTTWIEANPNFKEAKPKEQARRGEVAGVHLIAAPEAPEANSEICCYTCSSR